MTPTPEPALPRAFSHLAGANLAAQAAEQISLAAVPIVAVLTFNAGAREVGVLAAAQSLPFLLLALPFGLWADRASRRRLMVAAEAMRVLAMTLLAALVMVASGAALSMAALAMLGFIGAVGTVAFSVAAPAMVPALVPREALARANGRIELARSLAFAAGPALAGTVVAAAGGGSAFALAALLSALAVLLLRRLPVDGAAGGVKGGGRMSVPPLSTPGTPSLATPTTTAPPSRPSPLADLREGARFVWHDRLLRPVLLTAVVWNLAWMVLQAAYVPHAMQHLGLGARGVGLTLSLFGAGMVLGALAAPRIMARLPFGAAIALGPLVSVAAALVMAASLVWPVAALAGLSFFLFGAGPIVWTVSSTTLRQTLTPAPMLGRVGSIFLTANAGARPLGAALGAGVAALAGAQGVAACLVLAAAGFVVQAAVVMASAVRTLRSLPAQAAPRAVG
ncbi:MAG: MFS transporter [Burkholderiales bacterium]|nr:MFS transporter [Burkholderiales bacterium]